MRFTKAEQQFLEGNELGKLSTVGHDGIPHIVPVNYIYHDNAVWIATDYGTMKYRNLLKNKRVAFLIDKGSYANHTLLVQGHAKIIEKGQEFREIYAVFFKKFEWVRADPWKEREAPFIRINPLRKVSWGLAP